MIIVSGDDDDTAITMLIWLNSLLLSVTEITMMSRSKHLSFFSSFSHRSVNLTTSPPLPSSASAVPLGSGARAKLCWEWSSPSSNVHIPFS